MTRVRYLEGPVREDLGQKMVFLAGPRQVGKTTLARRVLAGWKAGAYLSWDNRADRQEIRAARWPGGRALVVLDELHKWRGWKGWLKGEFDKHREHLRFLVTGSARLDVYRRGGDSLQGRYHHYRLHPFSQAEVESAAKAGEGPARAGARHRRAGGRGPRRRAAGVRRLPRAVPRPVGARLRRWQKERLDRFFREDVRDLEPIRDALELPAARGAPARARRLAALAQRPARGSRGEPPRADSLDGRPGDALPRLPGPAVRGPAGADAHEDAEGLPLGLEPRAGPRRPLREPRGLAPAQARATTSRTPRASRWSSTTCATARDARRTSW